MHLPNVVDRRSEVVSPVRECAVRPVLDAVAPVVGVVDAHARLVVLQVVPTLGVAGGAVEVRAAGKEKRENCYETGKW